MAFTLISHKSFMTKIKPKEEINVDSTACKTGMRRTSPRSWRTLMYSLSSRITINLALKGNSEEGLVSEHTYARNNFSQTVLYEFPYSIKTLIYLLDMKLWYQKIRHSQVEIDHMVLCFVCVDNVLCTKLSHC